MGFTAVRGSITAFVLFCVGEAARFTGGDSALNLETVGDSSHHGARSLRYISGEEGAALSDFPAHCAAEIVQETCELLDKDDPDTISTGEVQLALSATREAAADLWSQMDLPSETDVTCEDFCMKLVDLLASRNWVLPPKSDVGCYKDAGGADKCDLDLSSAEIEKSGRIGKDLPDFGGDEEVNETESEAEELVVDYTFDEMAMHAANLFRIYPKMPVKTESLGAAGDVLLQANWTAGEWRSHIIKVNQVAEAYVSNAIRKFQARQTRTHVDWWFGPKAYSDERSREAIRKVLNSISRMLGDVDYVYPGPNCKASTYAYVYPGYKYPFRARKPYMCEPHEIGQKKCTKTTEGKFVFYLCDLTLRSDQIEQIETLTHEASHHATAYTEDVCVEDTWGPCEHKAYGRGRCHTLGRFSPKKALKNADNYCYYLSDVATKPSS